MKPITEFKIIEGMAKCESCVKPIPVNKFAQFFIENKGEFALQLDRGGKENDGHSATAMLINIHSMENQIIYHSTLETRNYKSEFEMISSSIQSAADGGNVKILTKIGDLAKENADAVNQRDIYLVTARLLYFLIQSTAKKPSFIYFGTLDNPEPCCLSQETIALIYKNRPMLKKKGLTAKSYKVFLDSYTYLLELCNVETETSSIPANSHPEMKKLLTSIIDMLKHFDSDGVANSTTVNLMLKVMSNIQRHIVYDEWASLMYQELTDIKSTILKYPYIPKKVYSIACLEFELKDYSDDQQTYNIKEMTQKHHWLSTTLNKEALQKNKMCSGCQETFHTRKELTEHRKTCPEIDRTLVYTEIEEKEAQKIIANFMLNHPIKAHDVPKLPPHIIRILVSFCKTKGQFS